MRSAPDVCADVKDEHAALRDEEADALFAALTEFETLLIAVSGGPDSLALLQLLAEWQRRRQSDSPRLHAATVDHRLRPDSGREAEAVAGHAARLSIPHATLVWSEAKPWSGVPDAARQARYRLLEKHALSLAGAGPVAVAVAHTRDDQAETVLMRLKRGTGVYGLSAMPAVRPLSPGSRVLLLRPFLNVPKTRLEGTLLARGLTWIEDPTNTDCAFERVRTRNAMTVLRSVGLYPDALVASARQLRSAREAIDYATAKFTETLGLSFNNEVYASFKRDAFALAPALIRQRVLAMLVSRFGGSMRAAEVKELERAIDRIAAGKGCTLAGAAIAVGSRTIKVYREVGRLDPKPLLLKSGTEAVWDSRFHVAVSATESRLVAVKPLGGQGLRQIRTSGAPVADCPVRAAYALPGFWHREELLAAPQLQFFLSSPHDTPADCATLFTSLPVNAV